MPELFIFLLKVNAALIVFCLAYYAVLRKLTFYTLNRFFLIAGIVFSSVYPFIDPAVIFGRHEDLIRPLASALPQVYTVAEQAAEVDYWLIMKVIFWLGVLFMALRMAIRFYSLFLIHRKSVPGVVSAYPVRFLNGEVSTFSFWKNIYLNPDHHASEEISAILEHEQVHVKQLHTVDILLAELSTVFYWFNPGVWYMRKAVKENVEFITDQNVLQKGVDRRAYQYSMLSPQLLAQPSVLMNNFNVSGIKRRIQMMNKKRSSGFQLVRYLFLLPVLLLITTAFTLFRKEVKDSSVFKNTLAVAKDVLTLAPSSDQNGIEISVSGKIAPSKVKRQSKKKQTKKVPGSLPVHIKSVLTDTMARKVNPISFAPVAEQNGGANTVVMVRYNTAEFRKPINLDSATVKAIKVNFTYRDDQKGKGGPVVRFHGQTAEEGSASKTVSLDNVKVIGYGKISKNGGRYINDERITPEDLAKINPDDITEIKMKPDPENKEQKAIFIYAKKANN